MMIYVDQELDVTGVSCPLPLLKAKMALSKMSSGKRLRVYATDGSPGDFASFAQISGHILLESSEQQGFIFIHYSISKRYRIFD